MYLCLETHWIIICYFYPRAIKLKSHLQKRLINRNKSVCDCSKFCHLCCVVWTALHQPHERAGLSSIKRVWWIKTHQVRWNDILGVLRALYEGCSRVAWWFLLGEVRAVRCWEGEMSSARAGGQVTSAVGRSREKTEHTPTKCVYVSFFFFFFLIAA